MMSRSGRAITIGGHTAPQQTLAAEEDMAVGALGAHGRPIIALDKGSSAEVLYSTSACYLQSTLYGLE